MLRWWQRCDFCAYKDATHHHDCMWEKLMRAARWAENGLLVVFADGSRCIHGPRACDDCISHDTLLHMST